MRFLEVNQSDLENDLAEFSTIVQNEASEELQLHSALKSLTSELQNIKDQLSDLSNEDLERIQSETIPLFQQQFDNISTRSQDALNNRTAIKHELPAEMPQRDLIDDIVSGVEHQLQQRRKRDAWLKVGKNVFF